MTWEKCQTTRGFNVFLVNPEKEGHEEPEREAEIPALSVPPPETAVFLNRQRQILPHGFIWPGPITAAGMDAAFQ